MDYIREHFEKKHPIFAPSDTDGHLYSFYRSGFQDGASQKYLEIANDREFLEALLQDLDQQDELKEQEALRRGLA